MLPAVACLVPSAFDKVCISEPIESISIKNFDMVPIATRDDLFQDQLSKSTAEGGERKSEVGGDA